MVTTFFLGHPGLALTGADGVGAFGINSTIASTFFSCALLGAPAPTRHRFAREKHQKSWGSMASARGESISTSCLGRSASSQ